MSDDSSIEEEVYLKYGMTRERYMQIQANRDWEIHQKNLFVQANGLLSGQARTPEEFVAHKIEKVRLCDFE